MRKRGTPRGKTETDTGPAASPLRRRITLIEILVVLLLVAVVGRFVYYLIHWQDVMKAIREATLYETVLGVLLGIAYIAFSRWSMRS